MESADAPFTAVLTIDPGPVIDGSPAHGFAESDVILGAVNRAPGSARIDLRWGTAQLATGITTAAFLEDFWNGAAIAHADALDFGRALLRRLLGHPKLRDRWDKIQGWRGTRPLRLELILPSAASSPISAIPFELLADETSFLFYAGRASLVRCVRDLEPRRAAIRRGDRLVIAWANPTNIDGRFDDTVFQQHETAVSAAGNTAHLDVRPLVGRAGLAQLQDALADHSPVPVVSLVAHGYPTGGQLALENPDRTAQPVTASDIAAAARAADTQVALLWSCHAARYHAELGSLAERLLDPAFGNLAAVVAAHGALQASWTARAARRLLHALTAGDGSDLEQAVTYARQTLSERDPQWAALAYYARPSDGRSVTYDDAAKAAIAALPLGTATNVAVARTTRDGIERIADPGLELAPHAIDLELDDRPPGGVHLVPRGQPLELGAPRNVSVDGLPRRPFYWVDRPAEVDEVVAHLAASRVVTVCGMPGIGKTEVARAAGERLIAEAALDAALWIALDELGSVDDLRARIAAWAGVPDPDASDARLAKAIGAQRALWILDGAEDLIRDHGPDLRRLLAALVEPCPGLQLLLTSQRPLGDLRSIREQRHLVHRIESPATCRQLFAAAAGSPLGGRADSDDARAIVELLDGHPRSLVLVASQVRDGGANLPRLLAQLRQHGDEAVLAAELLDSGIDWTAHDHLRAERLVSSLHLAYQPLRDHAPGAAELFCWLGALPAGLPVALAGAIFGDDAAGRVATLTRVSLVELRGDDERLDLPAPIRWYAARQLAAHVSAERQAELLARTLDALASLMAAAYGRMGKPGASAVVDASRRETLNLEAILERLERSRPATSDLARLVARAFSRWSQVRQFGGHNTQQVTLLEQALRYAAPLEGHGEDYASLVQSLGDLYLRTARLADAEDAYKTALAAFAAIADRLGEANTRKSLGDLYLRMSRNTEAESTYKEALDVFSAINERLGQARTRKAFGDFYLRTSRMADAEGAYKKALDTFTAMNERLGEANTRRSLGDLYLRIDRFADAEHAYQEALHAFITIDERLGEANTLLAFGDLYLLTSRPTKAEDAYKKALEIFTAIDERVGQANVISALGQLALARGRPDEGFEQFQSARARLLAIDDRLGAAGQLGYMARAALSALLTNRAIVLGGRAWQERHALDDRHGLMLTGQTLIRSALQGGDQSLARCAILLTWHHARAIEPPFAAQLAELAADMLLRAKFEADLHPDEAEGLERELRTIIADAEQRLLDAGEDPFSPLPPTREKP